MGRASVWDLGFPGGSGGGSSHPLSYPTEVLLAFLWWEHLSWRPVRAQGSEGTLEEGDGPQAGRWSQRFTATDLVSRLRRAWDTGTFSSPFTEETGARGHASQECPSSLSGRDWQAL